MLRVGKTSGTLRTFQRAELEPPTLASMRRLSKADVEALLQTYDTDPIASLTSALSVVLGKELATWHEALEQLPSDTFDITALLQEDIDQLDALVKRLVENRSL